MITNQTKSVLIEAKELTEGQRRKDYGDAVTNFSNIARLWTAYLRNKKFDSNQSELCDFDAAAMMLLLKLARTHGTETTRDTYVDLCGYGRLMAELDGFEYIDENSPIRG